MTDQRGVITYRTRAEQGRDFSGLRFGTITPTDIDASIDVAGRVFVYLEAKHGDAQLPHGQRKHLAYLCLSHRAAGHAAIALVLTHNTPVTQQIRFAECWVSEYFWTDGKWRMPVRPIRCRAALERFFTAAGVCWAA